MDEPAIAKLDRLIKRLKGSGERYEGGGDDDSTDDEECDAEVWDTLSGSFRQAQSLLDQNRALIQQVNENHQSKIPDNLRKNVALIRQINGNISKVLSVYSDLSVNFSNIVHQRQRRRGITGTASTEDDENENGYDKAVESKGDSVEQVIEKTLMIEGCGTAFLILHYPPADMRLLAGVFYHTTSKKEGSSVSKRPLYRCFLYHLFFILNLCLSTLMMKDF